MKRGFTLIEIIIVIIIVGVLAALGLSQYSLTVEKSRVAEAKVRIGVMRQLTHEYYLNNGTLTGIQNTDAGVGDACSSTSFYRYLVEGEKITYADLEAIRCSSNGKTPNSRQYNYYLRYYPSTGQAVWHCIYSDDSSSCFGLPP